MQRKVVLYHSIVDLLHDLRDQYNFEVDVVTKSRSLVVFQCQAVKVVFRRLFRETEFGLDPDTSCDLAFVFQRMSVAAFPDVCAPHPFEPYNYALAVACLGQRIKLMTGITALSVCLNKGLVCMPIVEHTNKK